MNIPNKIKLGGHTINIVFKDTGDDLAIFDWDTNTIYISNTIPPDQQESAFIHEVIHGCNPTLGSTEIGHALLDSLSEQLYQVFSENGICFSKEHVF